MALVLLAGCGGATDVQPEPRDLRVAARHDVVLPERRLHSLSPDGRRVLSIGGHELCVHETADLQRRHCADVAGHEPRSSSLTWSPDGRFVSFSEDWEVRSLEPDIWVLEVATATLRNLTDDAADGPRLPSTVVEPWEWDDDVPVFTPDSRDILFTRTPASRDRREIWRVPVAGGDPDRIRTVQPTTDWLSLGPLQVTADGRAVLYSVRSDPPQPSLDGLWRTELADFRTGRLVSSTPGFGVPGLVALLPSGDQALAYFWEGVTRRDAYGILDLRSGAFEPLRPSDGRGPDGRPASYTRNVTLSPDGRSLLFVYRVEGRAGDVLAVRDLETGHERVLLDHADALVSNAGVFSSVGADLSWARDGSVLVNAEPVADLLLRIGP